MPVIFQKIIKREDLRRNPDVLYVFGDNLVRVGMGGQAGEMRHERNAVGVATKASPSAYFREDTASTIAQKRAIDEDMKPLFVKVNQGGIVVWPSDGIGTGLSDLPNKAPSTFDHIENKLTALLRIAHLHSKEAVSYTHLTLPTNREV